MSRGNPMKLEDFDTALAKWLRKKGKNPYWLMKRVNAVRLEHGVLSEIQTRKVADYVRGQFPSLKNALWIAKACGCSVEDLWSLKE